MKKEMFVSLLIPDTTALTALNALKKLGFDIEEIKRYNYYSFEYDESLLPDFDDNIVKSDILVNANKHHAEVKEANMSGSSKGVLVTDDDDECKGILNTLTNALGFKGLKSVRKGTYWTFEGKHIDLDAIAKALLYNPNYQTYQIR